MLESVPPRRRGPGRRPPSDYTIVYKLAEGGMAALVIALHHATQTHVVLKRIKPEYARDPKFIDMFLDEANLISQLSHGNIARFLEIGTSEGDYYFTMEYVHGHSVMQMLLEARRATPKIQCPLDAAITILADCASGLHAAHEAVSRHGKPLDIVHRDLTPSNILVGFDGNTKIVDFGVAKAAERRTQTQVGTLKGKVAYMSPEQILERPLDRRSDIFSLGIVAYEMLTRSRLFFRPTDFETSKAIREDTILPPSSRRDDIPPELDAIVMKCLSRDLGARYQTADELREDLLQAAATLGFLIDHTSVAAFMNKLYGDELVPWLEFHTGESTALVLSSIDLSTADLIVEDAEPAAPVPAPEPAEEIEEAPPSEQAPVIEEPPVPESPVAAVAPTLGDARIDMSAPVRRGRRWAVLLGTLAACAALGAWAAV
jgi:eukaryotic-like serine/threonine-protein kinase